MEIRKTRLMKRYGYVGHFFEGLARALEGIKWLHIKPDGTPAYKKRFDWVSAFSSDGRASALENGRLFYINHDGEEVD